MKSRNESESVQGYRAYLIQVPDDVKRYALIPIDEHGRRDWSKPTKIVPWHPEFIAVSEAIDLPMGELQ